MSHQTYPTITNFDEENFENLRKMENVFKETITMEDLVKLRKAFQNFPIVSSSSFNLHFQNFNDHQKMIEKFGGDPKFDAPNSEQFSWFFKTENAENVLIVHYYPTRKLITFGYCDPPMSAVVYD
ncbi:unnamed protein product [Caenorhabditis brenneri]